MADFLIKVALINPPPPSIVQTWDRPTYPSLAIGYLSGFLKESGIEVMAVDAPFDGLSLSEIEEILSGFKPNLLCFTSMTNRIVNVAQIAAILKQLFPHSVAIIGGPHSTVVPYQTLKDFPVFDFAIIGEGELTLLEVINFFQKYGFCSFDAHAQQLELIKGIAWRSGADIKINESREYIQNLDSLPFPDYTHLKRKIKVYPIFSSRGCPHQCIFCSRIHGSKLRVRSPKHVINEINYAIKNFNPKFLDFADDTFTLPKNRTMKICNLMIKKELHKKIKWTALSRVTFVDQTLFGKMKEAGCIKVDFGVESGNQKILDLIKKGIKIEDAKKAIKMAKKAGLKTGSYFILGHPNETVQTINDTINLATELNTTTISFGIMVPYPGTEVYDLAKKGSCSYKLISDSWVDFDKQLGNALELENISRKELEKLQSKAYLTFYLKNYRLLDIIRIAVSQRKLVWKIITKRIHSAFRTNNNSN